MIIVWKGLEKNSGTSLKRQLYSYVKEIILEGKAAPGERLPSSRDLSKKLDVSRNTVLEVYSQLVAEGFLEGKQGSGTVVATGITKRQKRIYKKDHSALSAPFDTKEETIDFRSGIPDFSLFPQKEWGKLYSKICGSLPLPAFRYCNFAGVWELRESISKYLFRTRGIECDPKNVMIISGATQGLALISKILYKNDNKVLVEDPIHPSILNIFASAGFSLEGIEADDKGMNTSLLKNDPNISLIYTTPSHQYPLGSILPIQRRQAIVQYASDNDCYVIESDYGNGSTFRFEGTPISSLYELNPDRVIYVCSFSKILTPALRLGFMLLPDSLIPRYKAYKMNTDLHSESLSQHVLQEFINSGRLEKHTAKMNKIYNQKRKYLISELYARFPGEFEIKGQTAGLHVLVSFHNVVFSDDLVRKITANGVTVYPVEDFSFQNHGRHVNEIILGYAHLSFSEIAKGVEKIEEVIHSAKVQNSI